VEANPQQSDAARAERGVHNPDIVDLIRGDAESGEAVLLALERRPWFDTDLQMAQLREKLNSYFAYVLDGHFAQHYPQYAHAPVRVQLEHLEPAPEEVAVVLREASLVAARHGLRFVARRLAHPDDHRAPWE
jgi:hypothetical protein